MPTSSSSDPLLSTYSYKLKGHQGNSGTGQERELTNWTKSCETRRSSRISARLCSPDLTKKTLTENVSLLQKVRDQENQTAGILREAIDGLELSEKIGRGGDWLQEPAGGRCQEAKMGKQQPSQFTPTHEKLVHALIDRKGILLGGRSGRMMGCAKMRRAVHKTTRRGQLGLSLA